MKKLTLVFALALLFHFNTSAQCSWMMVGDTLNFSVETILPDTGTTFVVGGKFTKIGSYDVAGIARWDGSQWEMIAGSGIVGTQVRSLVKYDGGIVAGGTFSMIDSVSCNNIAYYDGSAWTPIGSGLDYTGGITVSTLVVHNDDLYAAGTFITTDGDTVNNIAQWNGSAWVSLGSGINGTVNALCSYDGKLYAAGTFTSAGGVSVNNIAAWDGTSWNDVGGGVSAYTGAITVSTLSMWGDKLVVGGNFEMAGTDTIADIAFWSDSTWTDAGDGLYYTGAITVSTFTTCEYGGQLYVGASYEMIADSSITYQLQKWNGSEWELLDAGTEEPIHAIALIAGGMIVGGEFRGIGPDNTLNYLAGWSCEGEKMFQSLNQEQATERMMFELYPNPVVNQIHMKLYADADDMRDDSFEFSLSDITGRKVFSKVVKGTDLEIERGQIPAGIYYYDLRNLKSGHMQKGKVVLR